MFDPVWDALISNRYNKISARLDGYKRVSVKGEVYPGLVESAEHAVNGVLVMAVANADILQLDRFEGEYYQRQCVQVEARGGEMFKAETYVFRNQYNFLLSDSEWSVTDFSKQGMKIFLAEYNGFVQDQQG